MVRTTRRSALKALGATSITVSTAGCLESVNAIVGRGTDQDQFQQELNEVRDATERYGDHEAALEDGYEFGGPYVPGMGWHFTNPDYLQDAVENGLDRSKPQILTYLETGSGLTLGSAEYAIPAEAVDEEPDLFSDEDAERDVHEAWHTHEAATHVFALGNGERTDPEEITLDDLRTRGAWTEFHPPDDSLEAGDAVSLNWGTPHGKKGNTEERIADIVTHHPPIQTLHAWVPEENPNGVFAEVNSRFMDSGDDHDHEH